VTPDELNAQAAFESSLSELRTWLAANYEPAKARYVQAVRAGEGSRALAALAAEASSRADEAESRWSAVLFLPELPDWLGGAASFINEYAGNWSATSDLWSALEEAHSTREQPSDAN
jgi:hypothetical protein